MALRDISLAELVDYAIYLKIALLGEVTDG
jgi:hypothetical protein